MPVTRARLTTIAGWLVFGALVAATLLVYSARWFWLGEIAASFAWYLGWASLVGAGLLAATGKLRLGLVAFCLAGLHLWTELSLWIPDGRAGAVLASVHAELSIAACNLLWSNTQFDGFEAWAERVDPDLVVCLEVSLDWRQSLEGLRERFPHQLYSPADERWDKDTWGTAILSRLPFEASRLVYIDGVPMHPMECVVRVGGQPVTIRGAHPVRPGRARQVSGRNAVLQALAQQRWDAHGILLGDLNVTSSSPAFGDLLDASGLRDSRRGFGRQPSFRASDFVAGLEVAIDHILVGDAFEVLERRTDPMPGSDHRTVFARLALR